MTLTKTTGDGLYFTKQRDKTQTTQISNAVYMIPHNNTYQTNDLQKTETINRTQNRRYLSISFSFCKETEGLLGPTIQRRYPRRHENLIIYRYYCKGSTFYSFILRPWVEVRPGIEPRSPNWYTRQRTTTLPLLVNRHCMVYNLPHIPLTRAE